MWDGPHMKGILFLFCFVAPHYNVPEWAPVGLLLSKIKGQEEEAAWRQDPITFDSRLPNKNNL